MLRLILLSTASLSLLGLSLAKADVTAVGYLQLSGFATGTETYTYTDDGGGLPNTTNNYDLGIQPASFGATILHYKDSERDVLFSDDFSLNYTGNRIHSLIGDYLTFGPSGAAVSGSISYGEYSYATSFQIGNPFNPGLVYFSGSATKETEAADSDGIRYGYYTDTIDFQGEFNSGGYYQVNPPIDSAIGPIPEPSTWAMMLLGFGGLGFLAFRKTRIVIASAAMLAV